MKSCILHSKNDLASANIFSYLIKSSSGIAHLELKTLTNPDAQLLESHSADYFIAVSRHRSESGEKSLTVHTPGNWGANDMGGEPRKISYCYPSMVALLLRELHKRNELGWTVSLEADHHGPSLNKPLVFIEIGSSENEWKNETAGKIVAESVFNAINNIGTSPKPKIAFCAGGTHYASAFTKHVLSGELAPCHILQKYKADEFDFEMFRQAMERTCEKPEIVAIDWKGVKGADREKIIGFCKEYGIGFERI